MVPIESPALKERILQEIVPAYLRDNVKARIIQPDGTQRRIELADGEPRHRCQEELLRETVEGVRVMDTLEGNGAYKRLAQRSPAGLE
jgi:polyphosphate kinase